MVGIYLGFLLKVYLIQNVANLQITETVVYSTTRQSTENYSFLLPNENVKSTHCLPLFTTLTTAVRSHFSNPHRVHRFNMCEDENEGWISQNSQ